MKNTNNYYAVTDYKNCLWGIGDTLETAYQDVKDSLIRCNEYRESIWLSITNPTVFKVRPITEDTYNTLNVKNCNVDCENLKLRKVKGIWELKRR